jgi:hypothetical protein
MLIVDTGMPKFDLRVYQPRLCPHVFVLWVCRVSESSEQLGDILILLEYLSHLVGGISPIPTEFASEFIGSYISTVIFIFRQPCIAMGAFTGESA